MLLEDTRYVAPFSDRYVYTKQDGWPKLMRDMDIVDIGLCLALEIVEMTASI